MASRDKTITVIEDDPAALATYGRLLGKLGHRVVLRPASCDAAEEPAALLASDLLILDQQMPGLSGLDPLERLRRIAPKFSGRALLVTAFADAALRARAARLGVEAVIDKPVDPSRLLGTVERLPATCDDRPAEAPREAPFLTSSIGGSYTGFPSAVGTPGGIKEPHSMQKQGRFVTLALIALGSVVFGMVLAGGLNLTLPGRAAEAGLDGGRPLHAAAVAQMNAGSSAAVPGSFADIAERVNPAVVSITATEVSDRSKSKQPLFRGDPFEFFFGPQGPQGPGGPQTP